MKKFAVYKRISTDKQDFESQNQAIDEYLLKNNIHTAKIFEDHAVSGKKTDRQAYTDLKHAITTKQIDAVIAFDLSRIGRNFMEAMKFGELVALNQIELHTITKGILSFNTPQEQLVFSLHAYTAAQFSYDHAERVKAGIAAARANNPNLIWGAKPQNQRKKNKFKAHPTKLIENLSDLKSAGLTTRRIAELLNISQSKVVRLSKRYAL
jgi:DNA invertase Pin-like site-specific DNA recombinase